MAAPSLISVTATAYNSGTSPKSTASIAVQAGDILIAYATCENDFGNLEITIANTVGSNPTWVQQQERQPNTNNQGYSSLWSGVAPASENITVTFTLSATAFWFGGEVHVWRGSDGVGNTAQNNNAEGSGTPTVNLTTTQENSGISAGSMDWNAAGAATWSTGPGAVIERTDFVDGSHYAVHTATYADVSAAGVKAVAQTAPTTQRYQIMAAEVKGSSAPAAGLKTRKTLLGVGL